MASRFHNQVLAFQRKAEKAMVATLKDAAQELSEQANESRFKGGNMPIDFGFLRNSYVGALNSIPEGESERQGNYRAADFDMTPALLAINSVKLGDRLVLGWSANYAKHMEAKYSFMRLAAQDWSQICKRSAKKMRASIK